MWVAGEAACTGLHGANCLASNGLPEALVMGRAAGLDIAAVLPLAAAPAARVALAGQSPAVEPARVARLRQLMTADVGVIRDETGLRRALAGIADLEPVAAPAFANMLAAARMIATAARLRRDSRGAHCRSDFPGSLQPLPSRLTLAEATALKESA